MSTIRLLLLMCAMATLMSQFSGCTTIVRGGPAAKQEGVHYFLPMTIIKATPNSNGTLTVVPSSIPDRRHEYVVSASSVLGKYTFEAKIANGLLTELNMDADSTEIAKTEVEAVGAIEKARVSAERKAVEAREANVIAREDAIKTATKLVQDRKRALDKLQDKRALLLKQGATEDSDSIKSVDLEIATAQKDVVYAEEDLATLIAGGISAGNRYAGNRDGGTQLIVTPEAWGPVIYRVEQFLDENDKLPSVRLVRAEWKTGSTPYSTQIKFRTAITGNAPVTEPVQANFEIVEPGEVSAQAGGERTVTVKSDIKLASVQDGEILQGPLLKRNSDAILSLKTVEGLQFIEAKIPAAVNVGTYFLRFKYKIPGSDEVKSFDGALEFSVK